MHKFYKLKCYTHRDCIAESAFITLAQLCLTEIHRLHAPSTLSCMPKEAIWHHPSVPHTVTWPTVTGSQGQEGVSQDGCNRYHVQVNGTTLARFACTHRGCNSRVGRWHCLGFRWCPDLPLPSPTVTCVLVACLWCGLGMPFPKQQWY